MKEFLRFLKFVFFSISAGLIEMGVFALLTENSTLQYWPRYLIALIASVIWNFTFNRLFTFESDASVPLSILKVIIYYIIFTPLSTLLGNYLVELGWNEYLVTVINMVLNFVTEFLYQRFYVFKNTIGNKPFKI